VGASLQVQRRDAVEVAGQGEEEDEPDGVAAGSTTEDG